jgi:hypothetical protein
VPVRHVAPLVLLPKRPMIISQFDAAAALNHFSGGPSAARFKVHNVRVALDPYNRTYQREDFLCPILHEVMEDPVITPGGINFERRAIEEWLQRNRSCPVTRKRLQPHQLKRNDALLAAMAQVRSSQEDTIPEWPGADEQHVKVILVNYQDESHLHSFAALKNSSAIDALGGTSFYVLPAEVVQLGEFSVHFHVDSGPLFTVKVS